MDRGRGRTNAAWTPESKAGATEESEGKEMKQETNKVKLVRIEELLKTIIAWQSNHMEHHKKLYDRLFRVFLVVLGAALAAITTILVLVFKSG